MNFHLSVAVKVVQAYLHALNTFFPILVAILYCDDAVLSELSRLLSWLVLLTAIASNGLPREILMNGSSELDAKRGALAWGSTVSLAGWGVICLLEHSAASVFLLGVLVLATQIDFRLHEALRTKENRVLKLLLTDAVALTIQFVCLFVLFSQYSPIETLLAGYGLGGCVWLTALGSRTYRPFNLNVNGLKEFINGLGFASPLYTGWLFTSYAVIFATSTNASLGARTGVLIYSTSVFMLGIAQLFSIGLSRYGNRDSKDTNKLKVFTGLCILISWIVVFVVGHLPHVASIERFSFIGDIWFLFGSYLTCRCLMQYFSGFALLQFDRSMYVFGATVLTALLTPFVLHVFRPDTIQQIVLALAAVGCGGLLIHITSFLMARWNKRTEMLYELPAMAELVGERKMGGTV